MLRNPDIGNQSDIKDTVNNILNLHCFEILCAIPDYGVAMIATSAVRLLAIIAGS